MTTTEQETEKLKDKIECLELCLNASKLIIESYRSDIEYYKTYINDLKLENKRKKLSDNYGHLKVEFVGRDFYSKKSKSNEHLKIV